MPNLTLFQTLKRDSQILFTVLFNLIIPKLRRYTIIHYITFRQFFSSSCLNLYNIFVFIEIFQLGNSSLIHLRILVSLNLLGKGLLSPIPK